MTIATFIDQAQAQIKDHSPTILAALAVGGTVGTAFLSHKAGRMYQRNVDVALESMDRPLTGKEKFEIGWRCHVPAFVVGGAAVASILAGVAISNRRNAALMSMVTIGEATFREFRDKVEEVAGKPKAAKVVDGIAQDRVDAADSKELVFLGDDKVIFFDTLTSRYFTSTRLEVERAEIDINRQILGEMYASQNEWYEKLGLDRVSEGDNIGWNNERPLEVQFSATIKDEKPVFAISYRQAPMPGFHKIW